MPSDSKAQQKFMGMVHAVQKGDIAPPSKEVAETAKEIKPSDAKDFAHTKRKGLPEHVKKKSKKHVKEAFIRGFVNKATDYGLTPEQSLQILKNSELNQFLQTADDE